MKYTMTSPCKECPFTMTPKQFSQRRLMEFASSQFPCHKTADLIENEDGAPTFEAGEKSVHCAGALIFLEKRNLPNQMMRIAERLGMYDRTKLDMTAQVR